MALVKREIEFLSTWHNTAADANFVFPGEEQLTKWSTQTTFTEKVWRDLVKLAWHISPSLAVHLCARLVVACGPDSEHFCNQNFPWFYLWR